MPKFLVFKKEKVERKFFYKEGNSTVKWTVTQYHAKNERTAPKTYTLLECVGLGTRKPVKMSLKR